MNLGLINRHRTRQSLTETDRKLGTWNIRTLLEPAQAALLARELQNVKVEVAALQEVRWHETSEREFRAVDPTAGTSFKYHIYYSGGNKAEHGDGFVVLGKQQRRIIRWRPVSDRICVLRKKDKFFNYSLIYA